MSIDAAHHSRWRTGGVIFGAALIMGFGLQQLWPLSFTPHLDRTLLHIIGAPLLLLGTAIILMGKNELAQRAQPSEPGAPTTQLVTGGVYKYSRNPLYLGLTIAYMGLALGINMPWLLLLLVPAVLLTQQLLIKPEEGYLENKFGAEYQRYQQRTRRWC